MAFLGSEWQSFLDDAKPHGALFDEHPDTGVYVVRFQVLKPIPPRLSVIFGEIAHNLRSALDHLVCRLVESYGRTVDRQSFPVYAVEADFIRDVRDRDKKRGPGPLEGIPRTGAVWTLIEDAQPYKCGDRARDHPLYAINKLWNRDKHSVLNAAYTYPEFGALIDAIGWEDNGAICVEIRPGSGVDRPLEQNTHIATFRFDTRAPQPKMHMKGQFPLDIAFGDGEGERGDLGQTHGCIYRLAKACERVVAEAVDQSAPPDGSSPS